MICMPNTKPVIDDVALVDYIKRHATDPGNIHIYPMAAMTKGLLGVEMTEIGLLKKCRSHRFHQWQGQHSQRQNHAHGAFLCQGF